MRWKSYLRSSDPRFGRSAKKSRKTGSPQSSEYNLSRIEFLKANLSRLTSISGNLSYEGPAVYLHIIRDPMTGPWSYHLYVGQGENLKTRLREHENPFYRSRNPSLHYHVWDSIPNNESTFVVLSQCTKIDPIALNLLEAWGTSIFQTLPKKDLIEYLPDGTVLLPQAGSHLNIAHPLWQRISERKQDIYGSTDSTRREKFSELIRNSDGVVREYYVGLTRAFLDLKYSPNPAMRAYYHAGHLKRSALKFAATLERTRDEILGGAIKKVAISKTGNQKIYFGQMHVRINVRQIRLFSSDKVHIRGYLTQGLNPNVYATDATAEDPARRLSLRLTVERHGRHSSMWLTAGGDRTAMVVNTLVDIVENVPYEDIEKSPRRHLRGDMSKGRRYKAYSS